MRSITYARALSINLDVEDDIGPTGSCHHEPQTDLLLDFKSFIDHISDLLQQITDENSYKIFLLLQAQLRCEPATHMEDDSFIKNSSRTEVEM